MGVAIRVLFVRQATSNYVINYIFHMTSYETQASDLGRLNVNKCLPIVIRLFHTDAMQVIFYRITKNFGEKKIERHCMTNVRQTY